MLPTVRWQLSASRRHSETAATASRTAPIMASVAAAVAEATVTSPPSAASAMAGAGCPDVRTPARSASSARVLQMAANWPRRSASCMSSSGLPAWPPPSTAGRPAPATSSAASGATTRARPKSRARPSASAVASESNGGTSGGDATASAGRGWPAQRSTALRRWRISSPARGASSRLCTRLAMPSICSLMPARSSSPRRCKTFPSSCASTARRRPWSSTACNARSTSTSLTDKPLTSSRRLPCLCSMASSLMFVVSCTTARVSAMDLPANASPASCSSLVVASVTRSSNSRTTKPISSAPRPRAWPHASSAMSCTS
mmetsp:Transcript_55482/g.162069  ORF Transcript_55482/g.162069 Transcript_55482/m.162069 type:complete len:316 (-) Transcript_55482:940-1887(-)